MLSLVLHVSAVFILSGMAAVRVVAALTLKGRATQARVRFLRRDAATGWTVAAVLAIWKALTFLQTF